jgi:hypothetical protein
VATAKKKAAPAKPAAKKSSLAFDDLVSLLGKRVDDPDVVAMIDACAAKADKDYIVAKDHGFEYSLDHKSGEKKKVLASMFLHGPGGKKPRPAYEGLPKPFAFTNRDAMRKAKTPDEGWSMDDGDLPPDDDRSERDTWHMDGYDIAADYRADGTIGHYWLQATGEAAADDRFYCDVLHFATKPVDGPDAAALVAPALFLAWASTRIGVSPKHAKSDAAKQLAKRAITPVAFFTTACKSELWSTDFDPKLHKFLHGYVHQTFTGTRAPNREATDETIQRLWGLKEPDHRYWDHDYNAAFGGVVDSLYYVPDSWDAVDRLGALLDARWADFEATGFKQPPDLKLYEKAAKARDAIAIVPNKKVLAAQTRDDSLTKDLLSLIGTPLKDPAVKPIFARANLPIGKKIDEQANPELGVVYLGANTKRDGKTVLIVEYFRFHSTGESHSVRGLGKTVTFVGYPNELPGGIFLGASRTEVAKAYGKPAEVWDKTDVWYAAKTKRIAAQFDANDMLLNIQYGLPPEWKPAPEPPYSPADIY